MHTCSILSFFSWIRIQTGFTLGMLSPTLLREQTMNQVCSRAALLALVIFVCATLAFGQSDLGSISGFVKDPSGATIPNAKVSATNQTGLQRSVTTNESGFYTITNIPP